MKQGHEIRCVASTHDICGEGAVWHPSRNEVYWGDINRRLLHRFNVLTQSVQTWQFDQPVTAVTLTTDPDQLVIVFGGAVILWSIQRQKKTAEVFTLDGWPQVRCNDARVDPSGTLWIGTMQNNVLPDGGSTPVTKSIGQLISLRSNGRAEVMLSNIGISNTIAWSPSGNRMYFADTLANIIYAFDFPIPQGEVPRPAIFAQGLPRGLPDGSSVDCQGALWNCRYGGGCIVRFAMDGKILEIVDTPVRNPTTCIFAGEDLRTLYFTSAIGEGTSDAEPGSLFSLRVESPGLAPTLFSL